MSTCRYTVLLWRHWYIVLCKEIKHRGSSQNGVTAGLLGLKSKQTSSVFNTNHKSVCGGGDWERNSCLDLTQCPHMICVIFWNDVLWLISLIVQCTHYCRGRMRYAQIVMGPAGSGKSTYCSVLAAHGQVTPTLVSTVVDRLI